MVKYITKQACHMAPVAVSAYAPHPTVARGAGGSGVDTAARGTGAARAGSGEGVVYQELVLNGERVVLEVPESMAGGDGVIRLLQYVTDDGAVQYVATTTAASETADATHSQYLVEGQNEEVAVSIHGTEQSANHPYIEYIDTNHQHQALTASAVSNAGLSIPAEAAVSNTALSMPAESTVSNAALSIPAQSAVSNAALSIPTQSAVSDAALSIPTQSAVSDAALSIPVSSTVSDATLSIPAQSAVSNAALSIPSSSGRECSDGVIDEFSSTVAAPQLHTATTTTSHHHMMDVSSANHAAVGTFSSSVSTAGGDASSIAQPGITSTDLNRQSPPQIAAEPVPAPSSGAMLPPVDPVVAVGYEAEAVGREAVEALCSDLADSGTQLFSCDPLGACYVCGQRPPTGSAVWGLLEAQCGPEPASGDEQRVSSAAERLADVLDRELTITSDDVLCAGCMAVIRQCDRLTHSSQLYPSSLSYLRNLFTYGRGESDFLPMPSLGSFPLKRGPGRPRKAISEPVNVDSGGFHSSSSSDLLGTAPTIVSGAILGARGSILSGLKQLPSSLRAGSAISDQPASADADDPLLLADAISTPSQCQPLLILPSQIVDVQPKRKYRRKKQLQRPGRMYSRYQLPGTAGDEAVDSSRYPLPGTAGDEAVDDPEPAGSSGAATVSVLDHHEQCGCAVCAEDERHLPGDERCPCDGCVAMRQSQFRQSPPGVTVYRCPICRVFSTTDGGHQFRRHFRLCAFRKQQNRDDGVSVSVANGNAGTPERGAQKRRGRPSEPQCCTTCQQRFSSLVRLRQHCAETGHDKRRPCPFCRRLYHPEILKTHKLSHTGAFHCKLCNVFFCSKESLLYHMNRHSGAKPFKCTECGKGFRSPSTLFMHHRRNHTQEKPYRCTECPKRFAARMELEFHSRQHTGVRPFCCQLCNKSYTSRGSLTKHMLTHSQQRPFHCTVCAKSFFSATTYRAHMNVHNNVRPFACQHCGKTFYSQNKMSRHRKLNCRQARGGEEADVDAEVGDTENSGHVVLTVEVEPGCEVRVTSVDEPLDEGAVVLAENRPAGPVVGGPGRGRPWTASRRAASMYGQLQQPFHLVPDQPRSAIPLESSENGQ